MCGERACTRPTLAVGHRSCPQEVRTSTGCFIMPEEDKDGVLQEIADKIASVTHLPVENGEVRRAGGRWRAGVCSGVANRSTARAGPALHTCAGLQRAQVHAHPALRQVSNRVRGVPAAPRAAPTGPDG